MTPAPNASGAVAALVLGILFVIVFFVIIGSVFDDSAALTETLSQ